MTNVRVAHLITDLDTGGAEGMLVKLAAVLPDRFDQLVVCMTERGQLAGELAAAGVPVVALDMPRGRATAGGALRALRTLRAFRPHVLQTWLYHADFLGTVLAPWVGRPALVWNLRCADMDLRHYRRLTRALRTVLVRLSGRPSAVVANSQAGADAHARLGYAPKRWTIIANGFDVDRFAPSSEFRTELRRALGLHADGRLIGMVARRDPAKDHERFLLAVDAVCRACESARFLLVGAGVPDLATRVRSMGLADRVFLHHERKDIERVFQALDIAVLASAFGEAFPNVLGEAMACGVPCVATELGDVRGIVGDTGLVVPPADPDALAAAMLEALAWPDVERRARGEAARTRIVERYGLAPIAQRYADLYDGLAHSSVR